MIEHLVIRHRRLLSAVAKTGRNVVLACSSGQRSILAMDPVRWMTGFKSMGQCAAVIGSAGVAELFVRDTDATRAHEAVGDCMQVNAVPASESVLGSACEWIRASGIAGNELSACGIDGLSEHRVASVVDVLPRDWLAADRLLLEVARTRDHVEIEAARRATRIAEDAHRELVETVKPGVKEYVVAAWIDSYLKDLGSEDNFLLLSSSLDNRSVHPPTDRSIEVGDVFLAEMSPSCDGVFSQICRSIAIGAPSKAVVRNYAILLASLRVGLSTCGPGVAVAEVVRVMDGVLSDAGFDDYCRPPYMRARGHGLGIGSALPGDVTRASEEVLEVGDLLVLHPNQYLPASGYLLCGEPILVTGDGVEMLSSAIGELGVVGAA